MKNLTLAEIYELQGLKSEALEIYKDTLLQDPTNTNAKAGINRLVGAREEFYGVNNEMLSLFINLDSKKDFLEFERWLSKL